MYNQMHSYIICSIPLSFNFSMTPWHTYKDRNGSNVCIVQLWRLKTYFYTFTPPDIRHAEILSVFIMTCANERKWTKRARVHRVLWLPTKARPCYSPPPPRHTHTHTHARTHAPYPSEMWGGDGCTCGRFLRPVIRLMTKQSHSHLTQLTPHFHCWHGHATPINMHSCLLRQLSHCACVCVCVCAQTYLHVEAQKLLHLTAPTYMVYRVDWRWMKKAEMNSW